jgi:hypothetical protein
MSQTDLSKLISRARTDHALQDRLFRNFPQTLRDEGYDLDASEIETAKRTLSDGQAQPFPGMPGPPQDLLVKQMEFEFASRQKATETNLIRMAELSNYTVHILKSTLGNAALTYKIITWMNVVMFGVGIGLFVFAAFYGVFAERKVYSLVFGGLGTVSFATLFLLGPIEKSQKALSNLVQVEISFMNYFEQITFWETFALRPVGNPPMPSSENIEKASEMLQQRSKDTVDLLEKYVETGPEKTREQH